MSGENIDSAAAWDMVRKILALDTSPVKVSALAANKVMTAWATHANPTRDGGRLRWKASTELIAAETCLSRRTVQRVLFEALRLGWVTVDEPGVRNGRPHADGTSRETKPTWWEAHPDRWDSGDSMTVATIGNVVTDAPEHTEFATQAGFTDSQRIHSERVNGAASGDSHAVAAIPIVTTAEADSDDSFGDSGDRAEFKMCLNAKRTQIENSNSVSVQSSVEPSVGSEPLGKIEEELFTGIQANGVTEFEPEAVEAQSSRASESERCRGCSLLMGGASEDERLAGCHSWCVEVAKKIQEIVTMTGGKARPSGLRVVA